MKIRSCGWILLLSLAFFHTAVGAESTVVVYSSEDQVFSEPILKDFERDTGIRVKAVYDTVMEELKSRAPFWKKETLPGGSQRSVEKNTSGY